MSNKTQDFEIYRYLLLPITQKQIELFGENYTADEIRNTKNTIFKKVLKKISEEGWSSSRYELSSKIIYNEGDWFVFQLGRKKELEVTLKNLVKKEEVEDWPASTIIINNAQNTQAICISTNTDAFSSTSTVAKILKENLMRELVQEGLVVEVNKTFYKHEFWHMIKENAGDIYSLKFEFVSPNMANLNSELLIDLRGFRDKNNSQKTVLELAVNREVLESSIEVPEDDQDMQKMVEYVSEGAGDIILKRRSDNKTIKMNDNVRKIEVDEGLLDGTNDLWVDWDQVLEEIKRNIK